MGTVQRGGGLERKGQVGAKVRQIEVKRKQPQMHRFLSGVPTALGAAVPPTLQEMHEEGKGRRGREPKASLCPPFFFSFLIPGLHSPEAVILHKPLTKAHPFSLPESPYQTLEYTVELPALPTRRWGFREAGRTAHLPPAPPPCRGMQDRLSRAYSRPVLSTFLSPLGGAVLAPSRHL